MEIAMGEIWDVRRVLRQYISILIYCSDRLIGPVRTGVVMQQDDVLSKFSAAFRSDRGLRFRS
jgi:hypothetical protein